MFNHPGNSPWRDCRVFPAQPIILICQELHVLLVPVLLEHLIGLLLVEGAAHPTVGRMHGEDARAAQSHAFPEAFLDHA